MAWFDTALLGISKLFSNGSPLARRPALNFKGSVLIEENEALDALDITVTGGAIGASSDDIDNDSEVAGDDVTSALNALKAADAANTAAHGAFVEKAGDTMTGALNAPLIQPVNGGVLEISATGEIDVTNNYHVLAPTTEGVPCDLVRINDSMPSGSILILRVSSTSVADITIKQGVGGNITMQSLTDQVIATSGDIAFLVKATSGSWTMLSNIDNRFHRVLAGVKSARAWTPGSDTKALLESDGNTILDIVGGTSGISLVSFSSTAASLGSQFRYDHAAARFEFRVAGSYSVYVGVNSLWGADGITLGSPSAGWNGVYLDDKTEPATPSAGVGVTYRTSSGLRHKDSAGNVTELTTYGSGVAAAHRREVDRSVLYQCSTVPGTDPVVFVENLASSLFGAASVVSGHMWAFSGQLIITAWQADSSGGANSKTVRYDLAMGGDLVGGVYAHPPSRHISSSPVVAGAALPTTPVAIIDYGSTSTDPYSLSVVLDRTTLDPNTNYDIQVVGSIRAKDPA